MIGQTISHYRIAEKLGEGGMGVVYRAEDLKLGRTVALKFLAPHLTAHQEGQQRFIREAKAAATLDHPNVCTIYEIDEADGQTFLAMACIEGRSVREMVEERPLKVADALDIAIQAAQGLRAAHKKGIVHRDIKSANLMTDTEGQVKIMDFGLAHLGDASRVTETGARVGTPAYMSPEQARGETVDARSDIWSLGVVLYEMVSGQLPFKGEREASVLYAILNQEPEPLTALRSGIPLELDRIAAKALAKNREERYQHVEDLLVDLRRLLKPSEAGSGAGVAKRETSRRRFARTGLAAVVAAMIAVAAGLYWFIGRLPSPRSEATVAVLPFANVSGQEDEEYLSDSFTDALISELGFAGSLRVISRSSVMLYKGAGKPLREIAGELGASHVIEGSVLRDGDRIRVTAQLVDASEGLQVWSKRYERDFKDLLALQNDVAQSIVGEIRVALTPQQRQRLERVRQFNPEAHELYLKGLYLLNNRRSEQSRDQARQYLEQAIQIDPSHALAYSALSRIFGQYGNFLKMKEAALNAIELDDSISDAHATLAMAQMNGDWNWEGANASLNRALELNPSSAEAHHHRSHYLMAMGRLDEALVHSRQAIELAPFSLNMTEHLCWNYMFARDYDRAVESCKKVVEMEPNFALGYQRLGLALTFMGNYDAAIQHLEEAVERGRAGRGDLAYVYAISGHREQALRMADEFRNENRLFYGIALVHAALGNRQEAIRWLNKEYDNHGSFQLLTVHLDPRFDSFHEEPEFRSLIEKLGLNL